MIFDCRTKTSPSSRGRGLKFLQSFQVPSFPQSPSSRGRGLKSEVAKMLPGIVNVALFTRAWIEIARTDFLPDNLVSPSSRGRGLKSIVRKKDGKYYVVALFTRAWIEILEILENRQAQYVALFTRAWIEIGSRRCVSSYSRCRPLHEGVD